MICTRATYKSLTGKWGGYDRNPLAPGKGTMPVNIFMMEILNILHFMLFLGKCRQTIKNVQK